MRWQWQCLAFGLAMVVAVQAGEQRTRSVIVRPNKELDDVQLELRTKPAGALRVGSSLQVCFRASRDGYVTLWSTDAEQNRPVRIYPNEHSAGTADKLAEAIDGGQERCIGREGDGFSLEVARPLGDAELYLHYTRDPKEGQLGADAYPVIDFNPSSKRSVDDEPYASYHLRYKVVE